MTGLAMPIRSVVTSPPAAPPARAFARPFRRDAVTLGLHRDTALLGGGDALLPWGLPMTLGMRHQPDFVRAVAHACREQTLAGRDWYSHGAMALVGPRNAGRGHAARRLAAATGLPLLVVDVSTPAGRDLLAGTAPHGCAALPPVAVSAMAAGRCGNPIILVEGIRAGTDVVDLLGPFLDPDRSPDLVFPALGCSFDLGEVNWLIQIDGDQGADRLPPGWVSVVRFRRDADRRPELLSLIGGLADELSAAGALGRRALVGIVESAMTGHGTSRPLAEMADEWGVALSAPDEPA